LEKKVLTLRLSRNKKKNKKERTKKEKRDSPF
jgi:hypothetical protein